MMGGVPLKKRISFVVRSHTKYLLNLFPPSKCFLKTVRHMIMMFRYSKFNLHLCLVGQKVPDIYFVLQ